MAASHFLKQLWKTLLATFETAWGYMGTLAAMGIVVGVLGMGIFHACTQDGDGPEYRCFRGLFNCACAKAPEGRDEISSREPGPYLRFEYEAPGKKLSRLVYIDADGRQSVIPGSKVSEQRMEYDSEGRLVGKRNYSVAGSPVEDSAGVFARLFNYDDSGRLVRTTLLNAKKEKVVPRMPGYAEELISYDGEGRPQRIRYLDGEGRPIVNAGGECEIVFAYDDLHHEAVRTNTIKGKACDNLAGYAVERRNSTEDGKSELVSWHDKEGAPVCHPDHGGAALLKEHYDSDHVQRERLCGEDGVMPTASRVCTEHLVRTTPDGLTEWECYNAADGLPCVNPRLGYAERVCEYDKDGDMLCEYFWDGKGRPCPCYEKRYTKDKDGRRHVLTLHTDGSTGVALGK